MSMLTPPGLGGKKFRVTGDVYPRLRPPRRRRRALLAALATLLVLGLLGYGTLQLIDVFSGDDDSSETGAGKVAEEAGQGDCPNAPPTRADLPEPEAITVNVYNATTRQGLAQQTADALAARGFTIGEVANAPADLDGKVSAPALLLGGPAAEESGALAVLGTQLEGADTGDPQSAGHGDEPDVVDLVIGDGFSELNSAEESARRLAELGGEQPSPSADASGSSSDATQSPAC